MCWGSNDDAATFLTISLCNYYYCKYNKKQIYYGSTDLKIDNMF